jgi:hypothetical protein
MDAPAGAPAPRGEHSAKPEVFRQMIEQYYPNIPKIELNRRGPARPGWDAWGAEAEPLPTECPTVDPNSVLAVVEQLEDVHADIDAAQREPPADAA